jgi:predicted dehydrogenase
VDSKSRTRQSCFRFRNGALGTICFRHGDGAWNWDLCREAERSAPDVNSHFLSGTDGSLTLPRLEFWHYREGKSWHDELTEERAVLHLANPYAEQMRQFSAVVDGGEEPLCSAVDGMGSLEVTLAVTDAARSGRPISLPT